MKKRISFFVLFLFLTLQLAAQNKFIVVGNRGARGIMPENIIPGMIKGLELGATALSMNVVISLDKQVVVSQEPYFNHEISLSPNGKPISLQDEKKYNIYAMNYADVKKFDVGQKIHPRFTGQQKMAAFKPLLSDLLDAVEAHIKKNKLKKPDYFIEIKAIKNGDNIFQPLPKEYADLVMQVVTERKLEKRVVIESFDIRALQYVHEAFPKQRTALMIDEKEEFEKNIEALGFTPTIYSPYSVLVGKSLVTRCHDAGIQIIPWTVNSVKDILYFQNLGVDGIITDYPNVMKVVRDSRN